MNVKSPCKDCTKRKATATENCHNYCEEYIEYRKKLDLLKEQNREDVYFEYIKNAIYRKRKIKNEQNRT